MVKWQRTNNVSEASAFTPHTSSQFQILKSKLIHDQLWVWWSGSESQRKGNAGQLCKSSFQVGQRCD